MNPQERIEYILRGPGEEAKKYEEARKVIVQYYGLRGERYFEALCQRPGLSINDMLREIDKNIVKTAENEQRTNLSIDERMAKATSAQLEEAEKQAQAIKELEAAAKENQIKMEACLRDINAFKQEMARLKAQKERQEKEKKELENKREHAKKRKEEHEKKYKNLNQRRKKFKKGSKERKDIENEMNGLKVNIDDAKKEIKNIDKQVKNKMIEIQSTDKELKTVSAKLDEKSKELKKLEQKKIELEEKKKALQKLQEQNAKRNYSADGRPQELVAAAPEKKAVIQTELDKTLVQQNQLYRG